ncbi:MAG TPA: iron-containing redox enzyme family protein [Solirubrobacteraceae bacterium]|nr:iron-containing redox enzyme family protein [Solirubrobacteraceae bacterium]
MIAAQEIARRRRVALPAPRGPLSERLMWLLRKPPGTNEEPCARPVPPSADVLLDEDIQLSLYLLNELHYSSLVGVDERWEWRASLGMLRERLEELFEEALHALVGPIDPAETDCVGETLQRLLEEDEGPPLSRFAEREATHEQMLEHVIHRSAYQLKEADPHSFALPRLAGGPKAALVEIQFDEYGEGRAGRIHAELFAGTMAALGLDPTYGAYIDRLPAITLATVNLMTLFGIHRRWRGALVGHLAVFEMTSSMPNRRYGNALRRLGHGREVTAFYDEHVVADAVHESIAAWDLADGLARAEPDVAAAIVFGARALLALEAIWARHLLSCWGDGRSSLRPESASAQRPLAAAGDGAPPVCA